MSDNWPLFSTLKNLDKAPSFILFQFLPRVLESTYARFAYFLSDFFATLFAARLGIVHMPKSNRRAYW